MTPKQLIVPMMLHGNRVDSVLTELLKDYSRSQCSSWLKAGLILVNGQVLKPKHAVAAGDTITINVDFSALENKTPEHHLPECIHLDIIYEDEELLVINKPSGMVVHPGAGNPTHTLVNALLYHSPKLQQLPRAGIIHRLDKETTGLLIVAKTLEAYTFLSKEMQERNIQRHYLALVQGHLVSGGVIDTFYGRHPKNRLKMTVCNQGRSAITHYSILKQYNYFTLLDVKLLTGRTHQIRVHMAYINHPIVGDPLYGGRLRYPPGINSDLIQTLQHFKRQALHAASISFQHPSKNMLLSFQAPKPEDFATLIQDLDTFFSSIEES